MNFAKPADLVPPIQTPKIQTIQASTMSIRQSSAALGGRTGYNRNYSMLHSPQMEAGGATVRAMNSRNITLMQESVDLISNYTHAFEKKRQVKLENLAKD